VARHAEAGAVNVLLQKEDGRLLVAIQDNGRGFDTGTVKGMGLLGMEERARRLNGAFRVESAPGKGTVVQLSLPLEDDDAGTPPANEGLSQVPA
jgi:signal transduction histidine kinase